MADENTVSPLRIQAMNSFGETVKLLVTLGSGVLALSGTFAEKLAEDAPPWALFLLFLSWLALILSILFGILALYSVADSQHSDRKNWWALATPRLKWCYRTFLGGMTMLVVFAAIGTGMRTMRPPMESEEPRSIEVRGPVQLVYRETRGRCQERIPGDHAGAPSPPSGHPATGADGYAKGSEE